MMSTVIDTTKQALKASFYNFSVDLEDHRLALLNLKTGSFLYTDSQDETDLVLKILANPNEFIHEFETERLFETGFLVELDKNELESILHKHEQYCKTPELIHIILLPAETCNFKCPYCFVYTHRGIYMKDWVYEAIYKYLERMAVSGLTKSIQITWFGGEPLLASDKIISFMNRLKKFTQNEQIEIKSTLITNGYYLNVKLFDELLQAGISKFQLTFDGDKEKHDMLRRHHGQPTFDIIFNNLKEIAMDRMEKCMIAIRYNFLQSNLDDVDPFLQKYLDHFANDQRFQINFRPVLDFVTSRNDNRLFSSQICSQPINLKIQNELAFKVLEITHNPNFSRMFQPLPQPTLSWCPVNRDYSFYIGADGLLFPCNSYIGNEKKAIGRITQDGDIETEACYDNWKKSFYQDEKNKECINCKLLPICLGGCRRLQLENGKCSCCWKEDDINDAMKKHMEIFAYTKQGRIL
jgi:uncharacterized protein